MDNQTKGETTKDESAKKKNGIVILRKKKEERLHYREQAGEDLGSKPRRQRGYLLPKMPKGLERNQRKGGGGGTYTKKKN